MAVQVRASVRGSVDIPSPRKKPGTPYEPLSKLLVSPLIAPIVVPYIIPYITPFKEFRL